MDHYSGKKGAGVLVTRRKGYASFKDAAIKEDPNAQFCNRIGCHGRIKYGQNSNLGSSDKTKIAKSSNGNEITGKSARTSSAIATARKLNPDSKRKLSSSSKFDPSESSTSSESEAPEFMSSSSVTECLSGSLKYAEITGTSSGTSSTSSNVRPRKIFDPKSSIQNQNTLPAASAVPLASRSSYSLKNTKCNLVSGKTTARCSSLESEAQQKNKMKKGSSEGESSLSRSNSSREVNSRGDRVLPWKSTNQNTRTRLSQQNGRNSSSIIKETPFNAGAYGSSDSRQCVFSGEESSSASPVRTRRTINNSSRLRPSSQQNRRNSLSIRQPDVGISQVPGIENPYTRGSQTLIRQFSASGSRSNSLSSNNSENPSLTMPHDYFYRYNIDGIAEVLLALERVEQEELTHEQVLALETSLYLSSLSIYDQHRDMRMDIDNMSYEELLALEERMGTVSTALSEDALSNCLKKSIYYPTTTSKSKTTASCEDRDDIKCSICQEDYVFGDEIGKLVECQHGYHVTCIDQWLRMKNWCPICKGSAEPTHSS